MHDKTDTKTTGAIHREIKKTQKMRQSDKANGGEREREIEEERKRIRDTA